MVKLKDSRVAILGVAIDNLTMAQVLHAVEDKIAEGGFHQIATANVDFLINSAHDEELHEILCRCDLVLADGMPLVWASNLMGTSLKERVAGADLVPQLARLSAQRGYRIFLLGSNEVSSAGAATWMENCFPGACIAGRYCPEHQPLEKMNHEEILTRIEAARPDILLVAFGNPKQEKWLAMHRHRLKVPVCIGVGGSFDLLSGKISRAPAWMQRHGMEWLYRTIQEPTRLAKRYARNAAGLLRYLPVQLVAMGMQSKRRSDAQITKDISGTATVLRVDGDLTGTPLPEFEAEVRSAVLTGSHVVLDMSNTGYIGADGLGSLIYATNVARSWKRELWFTGLNRFTAWLVSSALLRRDYRVAPVVAEALRRIEPELTPVLQHGEDWAFCRIGGVLIPIHYQEVPELYRQVHLLNEKVTVSPTPTIWPGDYGKDPLTHRLPPIGVGREESTGADNATWTQYSGPPATVNG